MCGILGSLPATDDSFFKGALFLLRHRGPDGLKTKHLGDKISLGHTRLAIIDTSENASQPFIYEHLTVVLNGEIYNYIELRKELITIGYTFRTQSDTEVIAAAYLKWGAGCLQKFNGMWALAIWDKNKEELFLSRDRFGKKPLFYTFVGGKFIFASEMKALMPFLESIEVSDNFMWMARNIFAYEATDMCLIKNIKRFPAAHYAYFRNQKLQTEAYWNTYENIVEVPASYEAQQEQFESIFTDACAIRMRSDVALGTSLSGGLDSSVVTSVVNFLSKQDTRQNTPVKSYEAFTAYIPNSSSDESEYAVSLCKQLDIKLNLINISSDKALDDIYDGFYHFEELYLTPSYPMTETYNAFRSKNVLVSLDGHGADEMFSGYRNFMFLSFLDSGFRADKIKEITQTYNDTFSYKVSQHFDKRNPYISYFKTYLWYHLISNDIRQNNIPKELRLEMIKKMGYLNFGLYLLFHNTILPTLLRNFDRYAMKHGVEVRMPFMDHRLVSFCFGLPWQSKIRNGYTKAIVRDALKKHVPENILYRKAKAGYQAPLDNWMGKEWRSFLQDTVNSQDFNNCILINPEKIKKETLNFLKCQTPSYLASEILYKNMAPYFWEQGFLKKVKTLQIL